MYMLNQPQFKNIPINNNVDEIYFNTDGNSGFFFFDIDAIGIAGVSGYEEDDNEQEGLLVKGHL